MSVQLPIALLVEDELNLATALEIAIRKLDFKCLKSSTIADARKKIKSSPPTLIVLDRNLPDGDGLSLCGELREEGFKGAILILTAAGDVRDRVDGLRSGADDYLPKPFSWEELEARIEALMRRAPKESSLWKTDEGKLRILGPKGWIVLTPLEYKLALRLISANGDIVSRDQLLQNVWGFTLLPKTRTVDHFLGRLRKHFEENPEEPRHFLTVRGAGYRFQK